MSRLKYFLLIFSSVVTLSNAHFSSTLETSVYLHLRENEDFRVIRRLPNAIVPISYQLKIAPDLENFTFSGKVKIALYVKFDTDRIILHSKNLTIVDIQLVKKDTIKSTYTQDDYNDLLIVHPSETLIYDTNYWLSIEFHGQLNNVDNDMANGFYRTLYTIDGKPHWLATTHFEPSNARKAFPCFDEPRFKASFTVYLARNQDQVAITNMPSEGVLPQGSLGDNRIWEKFQPSPPLPTYLIAFMVSDYKFLASDDGRVRVFARPNAIENCSYALQQGVKLLRYLEGYTGIPYRSPKLDIVAVPEISVGAMENWGMTIYRESSVILSDPQSEMSKRIITSMIAHEFAHLWFGDLVTPAWFSYTWLKEGLATYFQYFAPAAIEPSWPMDHFFVSEIVQTTLMLDMLIQEPLTRSVTLIYEMLNSFDSLSYYKGASVLRMIEHMVSSNTFQAALHRFLKDGEEKHNGHSTPSTLFDAFETQVQLDANAYLPPHISITLFFKIWSENVGFPLITVTRSEINGEITITQTTYKSPMSPEPQPDQKWIVPLTYTTKSKLQFTNTKPKLWSFADTTITLREKVNDSDWILFNLQNIGYYRVNYDERNWHLIIDQLSQDLTKIHPLNRAQLVGDAVSLANDNMLSCSIAKKIWNYLQNETSLTPLCSLATSYDVFKSRIEGTSIYSSFESYIRNLIKTPYKNIGYGIKSTDSPLTKFLKPKFLSLACDVGILDCIKRSLDEYRDNEDDLSMVQSELQEVVYCNALRYFNDDQKIYDDLWSTYTKSNNTQTKRQILKALLSCGRSELIIKNLLTKIINPKNYEISKPDVFEMLKKIHSETPLVTATIKFIEEKFSEISELTEESLSYLKNLLLSIKPKIKTSEQRQMIDKLETKTNDETLVEIIRNMSKVADKMIADGIELAERLRRNFLSVETTQ